MALLECCLSNVSADARTALHDSEHRVRESMCLDRCGDCHTGPFLVVDSEFSTWKTDGDLIAWLTETEVSEE